MNEEFLKIKSKWSQIISEPPKAAVGHDWMLVMGIVLTILNIIGAIFWWR